MVWFQFNGVVDAFDLIEIPFEWFDNSIDRYIYECSNNLQAESNAQQQQQPEKEAKKFVFSIENILRPDPPPSTYSSRTPNQDRHDYFPLAVSYAGQLVNHRFVNSLT